MPNQERQEILSKAGISVETDEKQGLATKSDPMVPAEDITQVNHLNIHVLTQVVYTKISGGPEQKGILLTAVSSLLGLISSTI